jgi:hypothetical protein
MFMHRLAVLVVPLLLIAAPAHAADRKFDADADAKAIAPFLDDRTVAVAHVDLTRLDVDALADKIAALTKLKPDDLAEPKKVAAEVAQALTKAGVRDAFLVVSLADLPNEPPFVVLPLEKGADVKAILALTPKMGDVKSYSLPPKYEFERIGDAAVLGGEATRKRLKDLKPEPRPEVAKAFAASGDGVARAALFAPTDARKVLEETLPDLPPDLGGGSIKVLTRGLQWVALTVDAPPKLTVRGIVQASDKDAAKALHELLTRAVKFFGKQKDVQEIVDAEKLLEALRLKVDGDRLTLTADEAKLTEVLAPAAVKLRALAAKNAAADDAGQLGRALHRYHDANGRFPPVASFDKQDRPLLSWRVHVLPHLGEQKLYKEFKLDEPWDSEHNKKLIAKMPKVFANPAVPKLAADGKTTILAPVHKDAVFTGDKQGVRVVDITDGTSATVLLVDADESAAVVWTKPDDLKLDPKDPHKGLSARWEGAYLLLFADGSVHFVAKTIDNTTLWALFTRNGGEAVNVP